MAQEKIGNDEFKRRLFELISAHGDLPLSRVREVYRDKYKADTPYARAELTNFIKSCGVFSVGKKNGSHSVSCINAAKTTATKITPDATHAVVSKSAVRNAKSTVLNQPVRAEIGFKNVTPLVKEEFVVLQKSYTSLSFPDLRSLPIGSVRDQLLTPAVVKPISDPRSGLLLSQLALRDCGGFFGFHGNAQKIAKPNSWRDVGNLKSVEAYEYSLRENGDVFLRTLEPFCALCIGVQGAGKSHTMNVMLENCLLPALKEWDFEVISANEPMCGLVMHFDQSQSNACEAVGLCKAAFRSPSGATIALPHMVVLVSPSFYHQRVDFYKDLGVTVLPLLFDWGSLTAAQLRKLMRLGDSDAQLYVSTMLRMLREYQRKDHLPTFDCFLGRVKEMCDVNGQSRPLEQRLELLKNFIRESDNNSDIATVGQDWRRLLQPGTVVVADLTDPMLSADEACGVFQVLLEQFRSAPVGGVGKVVAFDEAHRYLSHTGPGCTELSQAVVDTVRMMRHEGMRILLSTQSPTTLPPELLELASMTVLHRFQSAEWINYLASKVPLPEDSFERIKRLQRGQALVLSTKISSTLADPLYPDCATVTIRPRLTWDLGASRMHDVPRQSAEKA